MKKPILLPALATAGVLAAVSTLQGQTIAYWRFESSGAGLTTDASGNNRTLNNTNVAYLANPGFPVPGATGLAPEPTTNVGSASFVLANNPNLNIADGTFLPSGATSFTIESFVRLNSATTAPRTIASHWDDSDNNRGWRLVSTATDSGLGASNLVLQLSSNGQSGTVTNFDSDFVFQTNTLYYVAASVSIGQSNTTTTFYIKDLTANTDLQSVSRTASITTMFNSNASFRIGASEVGTGGASRWDGVIDEVRLSSGALAVNQLLVAIPEPSAFAALAGLGALGFAASRRRRS